LNCGVWMLKVVGLFFRFFKVRKKGVG